MDNRPRARQKNVTSGGSGASRRGSGLGTGPVGSTGSFSGRGGSSGSGFGSSSGNGFSFGGGSPFRRSSGKGGCGCGAGCAGVIGLLLICVIAYFVISAFNSGSDGGMLETLGNLLENSEFLDEGNYSGGYSDGGYSGSGDSYSAPDTSVAAGSREKRTKIAGNGADSVTLMMYMCGTDLESKHGMASSDIKEMAAAKFGDNVDVLVYTGGCRQWKINGISNSENQIYKIENGKLDCLEKSMGRGAMTDPDTLSAFIRYCADNYPANRYELILWDHGGGSVTGYGYDERESGSGSMDLAKLDKALEKGGVMFDFIGFDACLMATAETAFMTEKYADYLIASEETEPGIGWYYTNWLTSLGNNTSASTLDIGKEIVDDFVGTCASQCRGQKTTLSVIDLAEFANTVPEKMSSFAGSVSEELKNSNYKKISDARYSTREFAQSSKIDQVDLIHLAQNIGTSEAKELVSVLRSAVKYNRTSRDITNANGVSIYFPYKAASKVDSACNTYSKIGMDDEYAKCIRQFASMEASGQIAAGGTSGSSPAASLFGDLLPSGSDILSGIGSQVAGQFVSGLIGNISSGALNGLDISNSSFMNDIPLGDQAAADYFRANTFDRANLRWNRNGDTYRISLPESQWSMVHDLDKNMFYDDGSGYIDLGIDNVFDLDENGNLVADTSRTWVSVNGQPVAYYHMNTTEYGGDRYSISGYVPALLNGDRVNIIISYDSENENGYIAGASADYRNGETETAAKNLIQLTPGDELEFICDYYSYSGDYIDSYFIGDKMKVTSDMKISDTVVGNGAVKIMYRFTDMYNMPYWTEAIDIR